MDQTFRRSRTKYNNELAKPRRWKCSLSTMEILPNSKRMLSVCSPICWLRESTLPNRSLEIEYLSSPFNWPSTLSTLQPLSLRLQFRLQSNLLFLLTPSPSLPSLLLLFRWPYLPPSLILLDLLLSLLTTTLEASSLLWKPRPITLPLGLVVSLNYYVNKTHNSWLILPHSHRDSSLSFHSSNSASHWGSLLFLRYHL